MMAGVVAQDTIGGAGEGTFAPLKASKMGYLIVQDFYTQMAIEGRVFQITAGTIATPLAADVVVTDVKADFALDPATGYVCIPVFQQIATAVGTGATINTLRTLSNAVASSAGAAMVPLNINPGGPAVVSTARVAAAGGVTVSAELVTTTRQHFTYGSPTAITVPPLIDWNPRCPPTIGAGYCLFTQLAATGAGFTYYAHLDFIELPLTAVS
jgi:hypothetical protein